MAEPRNITIQTLTESHPSDRETVREQYATGAPHGDEEVGGAVAGGVTGAVVGAVVGGPIGAVVGGAIGATAGATAGAIDAKAKDETVVETGSVVTHEVTRP